MQVGNDDKERTTGLDTSSDIWNCTEVASPCNWS